ncbi:hypothetical protein NDU88_007113 [Pleurodeles waltl]|uniref:Uncharacterized protein n=1 Tax=Pleurodeles waltl TaxID=8319 RepID=A0AAV7WGQ0_PLEWA|nr:hypothetical protein NDU88_007113 [Pleurodeles waltl]
MRTDSRRGEEFPREMRPRAEEAGPEEDKTPRAEETGPGPEEDKTPRAEEAGPEEIPAYRRDRELGSRDSDKSISRHDPGGSWLNKRPKGEEKNKDIKKRRNPPGILLLDYCYHSKRPLLIVSNS